MTVIRRVLPFGAAILLAAAAQTATLAGGGGVTGSATGGGSYLLLGTESTKFAFSAIARADGSATGRFHHSLVFQGETVDFQGAVTCVTFDPDQHRAWIGGVITRNDSTHSSFVQPRNQVGRDIWFRVVDYGEGAGDPEDRTTFVGFEGDAGLATSADYCDVQPWPEGDARTWPVTKGNIQVRP
jgi:hypothetical protein